VQDDCGVAQHSFNLRQSEIRIHQPPVDCFLPGCVNWGEIGLELLSHTERESLYGAACRLTTVDGRIADEERVFLRRLRDSLELDETMAATIERNAGVSQV
jgi:hypothetical protein